MRISSRPGGLRAARSRADAGLLVTIAVVVVLASGVLSGMTAVVASATVHAAGAVVASAAGPAGAVRVSAPAPDAPGLDDSVRAALADRLAGIPVAVTRTVETQPTPLALPASASVPAPAPAPAPNGASAPFTSALLLADESLADHAVLVSGSWLDGSTGSVVVQADAAAALGLAVGSPVALGSGGASFTVAGTWRAADPLDPVWLGEPGPASGVQAGAAGPFVVSESDLLALPVSATTRWTVTVPGASATEQAGGLTAGEVEALPGAADRGGIADAVALRSDSAVAGLTVTGDLPTTAARARTGMTSAQSLALVPTVLVGVLALIGLSRLAGLLAARRRTADALLSARGAAPAQFARWSAIEGVLVTVPAAIVGTAVGLGVAWALRGGPGALAPGSLVTPALLITVAALGAGTIAALVASGVAGVRADAAERSGRPRTAGTLVAGAAVAVLAVVAGLAVWQLELAGSASTRSGAGGAPGPLAVLAPTLVLLSVTAALVLAATLLAARSARPRQPGGAAIPADPTSTGSPAAAVDGPPLGARTSTAHSAEGDHSGAGHGVPGSRRARVAEGAADRPSRSTGGGSVARFLAGRTVAMRASVFAAAALVVALAAGGAVYAAAVTATAGAQNSAAAERIAGADLRLALGVDSTVGAGVAGPDSSRYAALPGVAAASTVLASSATIARDEVTLLGLPASAQRAISGHDTVTPDAPAPALDGSALSVALRTDAAASSSAADSSAATPGAGDDGPGAGTDAGAGADAGVGTETGAGAAHASASTGTTARPGVLGVRAWVADADGALSALDLGTADISATEAATGATLTAPLPAGPAPFHLLALDVSLARSPVEGDLSVELTAVAATDAPTSAPSTSPAPAPGTATGSATGTATATATIDPARLSAGSVSVSAQRTTARVQVDAPAAPVPVTVTGALASHLGLAVGDSLDITPTSGRVVSTRIEAVTDDIPGSTDPWTIAADLTALDRGVLVAGGSVPQANQIWIAESPSSSAPPSAAGPTSAGSDAANATNATDADAAAADIAGGGGATGTTTDIAATAAGATWADGGAGTGSTTTSDLATAAVGITTVPWSLVTREGSTSDGFTGPVVGALWTSAAAATALAVLAVLAAAALLRRAQRRERAVLTALGMTDRQQSRRSALQTSLTVAVAVAAGLLAGAVTALLCAGPATASLVFGLAATTPAVIG